MVKIFIGTEPTQWLPTEVLKYSVKKRTKAPVEFHELQNIPLNLKIKMYTGFSFYRFSIPENCGYQGKAIYLDADMVCLGDIQELNDMDLGSKNVLARTKENIAYYTSCMLMDCERLKHWKIKEWVTLINAGLTSYQATMIGASDGMNHEDFGPLSPIWNDFDHYDEKTKIIHYTNVPTQPWKKAGHPYRGAFLEELNSAIKDGVVTKERVQKEIEAGHIYPEILQDMEEYTSSHKKN